MKFTAALYCVFLAATGCAAIESKYKCGEIVRARHFSNFPQYNDQPVKIIAELQYRWIKDGNTLIVYEVETIDGKRIAAQEFQLSK